MNQQQLQRDNLDLNCVDIAKDALEIFPNKKEKKILVDLIDFILNRSF